MYNIPNKQTMPETPLTFEEIEHIVQEASSPEEVRMLKALANRDWQEYQDAVTELYMQKMFRVKIDRVIRRAQGQGGKKPGSRSQDKHK